MSKFTSSLASLCLILCAFASHAEVTLVEKVTAYLADKDVSYASYAYSGELIVLAAQNGSQSIEKWPAVLGPQPSESELPRDPAVIASAIAGFESRRNLARQAAKSVALKNAETAFIAFLKSENLIASDAKTVTRNQLAVAMAVWAQLPDEQAEIKYSKYARLVKWIEISGGSEYDVWEH